MTTSWYLNICSRLLDGTFLEFMRIGRRVSPIPFLMYLRRQNDPDLEIKYAGFIITGHPGSGVPYLLCYRRSKADITLGKSVLLWIALLLRLHAKLLTIYQCSPHEVFYFTAQGVHIIKLIDTQAIRDAKESTPQVWALVDSNIESTTVKEVLFNEHIFVVQTPSPRGYRLDWWRKRSLPIKRFILKP